ncbi:MAG: hypothetical protein ABI885_13960 [Gammaproteobacteria bacterium]
MSRPPRREGSRSYSTVGRPRALTDEQAKHVLEWHKALNQWKALRGTLKTHRQLAKELGVTTASIWYVIKCSGEFKRPAPVTPPKSELGAAEVKS